MLFQHTNHYICQDYFQLLKKQWREQTNTGDSCLFQKLLHSAELTETNCPVPQVPPRLLQALINPCSCFGALRGHQHPCHTWAMTPFISVERKGDSRFWGFSPLRSPGTEHPRAPSAAGGRSSTFGFTTPPSLGDWLDTV